MRLFAPGLYSAWNFRLLVSDLVWLEARRTRSGFQGGYDSRVNPNNNFRLCPLFYPDLPGRIPSHARHEPLEAFTGDTGSWNPLLVNISLDRREYYLAGGVSGFRIWEVPLDRASVCVEPCQQGFSDDFQMTSRVQWNGCDGEIRLDPEQVSH